MTDGAACFRTSFQGTGFGVVEASTDPAFAVGDSVMGPTGWREVMDLRPKDLVKVDQGISAEMALGALGTNGLTVRRLDLALFLSNYQVDFSHFGVSFLDFAAD